MAAAPAAPAVGYAAAALTTALGFAVAFGLHYLYTRTLSRIVTDLADRLDGIAVNVGFKTIHLFGPLSTALRFVDDEIEGALAFAVRETEHATVYLLGQLTDTLDTLGRFLVSLTETVEHRFHGLLLLFPPAALMWASVRTAQAVAHLPAAVARLSHAVTAELPNAIGHVRGRVGRLERETVGLGKRLRAAEVYLTAAGAAVLFVTALKRLGLGWIRCRNVGKVGKRVCGMDASMLDALLAGATVFYGTVSIVEFAHELQALQDEAVGAIRGLVREA